MPRSQTLLWLAAPVLGAALALGAELWREAEVAPYTLPKTAPRPDALIAALAERVARVPQAALDRAELAALYLRRARRTGSAADRERAAEQAALSLETLPFSNPGARLVEAELRRDEHAFADALARCEALLADDPSQLAAEALALACLLELGRLDEALPRARALAGRRPGAGSSLLLGQTLSAAGQTAEARRVLARGLELEDLGELEVSARLRLALGALHAAEGDLPTARAYGRAALAVQADLVAALASLAAWAEAEGDAEEADALLARAYERSGRPLFLVRRAWLYERRGDRVRALELADAAEALLPLAHAEAVIELLLLRGDPRSLHLAAGLARIEAEERPTAAHRARLARVLAAQSGERR